MIVGPFVEVFMRLCLLLSLTLFGCASSGGATPAPEPPIADGDAPSPAKGATGASGTFKAPRFVRSNLGDLGVSAYLPKDFPSFDASKSQDGSDVRSGSLDADGYTYSCIAVRFAERMDAEPDELEVLLESYLDFLKGAFEATESAGYGRGHTLESDPEVRGLLDYWKSGPNNEHVVMGWVNQTHLIVLAISGPRQYPAFPAQQLYLRGARFSPAL